MKHDITGTQLYVRLAKEQEEARYAAEKWYGIAAILVIFGLTALIMFWGVV